MTQHLGDEKAQELLRRHNQIVRQALRDFGGAEIKHTGDGIMASFPAATRAMEWAIAVQRAVAAHAESEHDTTFAVRIGVNAGEPVSEEGDIFGTSVQLAARICDQADGWEIVVSDVVRQLAAGKGFLFAEREPVALKGFEEQVRVFELHWRDEG
jgi:class 3 adenylate cyclase